MFVNTYILSINNYTSNPITRSNSTKSYYKARMSFVYYMYILINKLTMQYMYIHNWTKNRMLKFIKY